MFALYANKNQLTVRQRETLTSGSVNVCEVQFEFSSDWDGLTRTAVFRAGDTAVSVLLDESESCRVPWEVLAHHGQYLKAGVYGTLGVDIVLPTVWACCGFIQPGTSPGTDARPHTPGPYEQVLDILEKKADSLELDGETLRLISNGNILSAVTLPARGGEGDAHDGNPVGCIISFPGLAAPVGYLIADGTEYDISAYPRLAEFFRQQFGQANYFGGDGESTFAVPDLSGRFLLGSSGAHKPASIGGEESVKLTNSHMPAHAHSVRIHRSASTVVNANSSLTSAGGSYLDYKNSITSTNVAVTNNVGGSIAHNNMPPFFAVIHCIKAV